MRALPIRVKLTLWYLLVTFAGALLFSVISYGVLEYALLQEKKTHLLGREERLIRLLQDNEEQHLQASLNEQLSNYALVTHEGNLFLLRRLDGSLLFPSDPKSADWIVSAPVDCEKRIFQMLQLVDGPALAMCHAVALDGIPANLYVGSSLDVEFNILRTYRNALLFLLPVILILSSLSGYFLSHRAMEPVDRMTRAAVEIGIGNLSARLPVPAARDEVQQLAEAWNQLLGRLEAAVSRLSQFSADVSHDLRTSITVMLATAQLSLHRHRTEREYRNDLDRIVTECRTASTLLDALLSLARSGNFMQEVSFQRIDLCDLVVSGCRRVEDLAESSGILLDWHLPDEPVLIEGDRQLMQRLLGILLDNAIKYTPEHGEIHAEVLASVHDVVVIVRDTGIGMSRDVREQIFDRFYQADLRERKAQAGCGLGLSIARWIADVHRAELTVESAPLEGSVFSIRFPLISEERQTRPLEYAM
ncbi:HAMP domain-containing histidine kinase [Acidipila sp. 4G-K13]|uniref:histidine kinase n=2 Tax=Paracidobacterium acidisoli TaxID=2303751 RepID=A0A372ILA3_9BACT|nr:HAMP domain-containing histidine kinase [Paracidobacterium acidisoli]